VPCFFIPKSLGIYAFFMQNLPYTDDKCGIIDIVICQVYVIEERVVPRQACLQARAIKKENES
jgi:hypothetical protein